MAGHRAQRPRRAAPSQHFLRSQRLAGELVRSAEVAPTDLVVEIGAGTGRLTRELARRAGRVEAIELDPALAERVRRELAHLAHVRLVAGDALRHPLPAEPFRVFANLPFARTTAILRRLLDDPAVPLERADVIVQWDVACKRAACWPSTLLNVWWGARFELTVVRRLPARLFEPAPAVAGGVLRIVRRADPLVGDAELADFRAFVSAGFRGGHPATGHVWGTVPKRLRTRPRGTSLQAALRAYVSPRTLKRLGRELGFDRADSARELDVHAWAALHRAVRAYGYTRPSNRAL